MGRYFCSEATPLCLFFFWKYCMNSHNSVSSASGCALFSELVLGSDLTPEDNLAARGWPTLPLGISIPCTSGHIFSEEVEGTQKNWYKGKTALPRMCQSSDTCSCYWGQHESSPFVELEKGSSGKMGPCRCTSRWMDKALEKLEKGTLPPGQRQALPRPSETWWAETGKPVLGTARITIYSGLVVTAFFTRPKASLFLFLFLFFSSILTQAMESLPGNFLRALSMAWCEDQIKITRKKWWCTGGPPISWKKRWITSKMWVT